MLDATTYLSLRDTIIKAALDEPAAVIVDITALFGSVRSPRWAVFTSARWQVSRWPEVPIVLVSGHTRSDVRSYATAWRATSRFTPPSRGAPAESRHTPLAATVPE